MLKSKPFLVIAGLALAAAGAFAAYHFLGRTSIADVKERCGDAPNRAVTVKGKVADTTEIPLVEFAFYQLDDGEDSIWVMTSREPPREGRDVKATGRALDRRAVERECGGREPDALCQALALGVGMVLGRCVLIEDRRE